VQASEEQHVPAAGLRRPYRADQVGSHLRPDRLMDARARQQSGEISAKDRRAVEDDCIREIVALQEDLGLPCVTDGEFRRGSWSRDFIAGFDNVVQRPAISSCSIATPTEATARRRFPAGP
jgi:methionine synthase II (cobalamin-independent)